MSLRRRLILSLFTILVLFAINVGTHFWGSFARGESMVAYRDAALYLHPPFNIMFSLITSSSVSFP